MEASIRSNRYQHPETKRRRDLTSPPQAAPASCVHDPALWQVLECRNACHTPKAQMEGHGHCPASFQKATAVHTATGSLWQGRSPYIFTISKCSPVAAFPTPQKCPTSLSGKQKKNAIPCQEKPTSCRDGTYQISAQTPRVTAKSMSTMLPKGTSHRKLGVLRSTRLTNTAFLDGFRDIGKWQWPLG